jgi:hypothetical protein
MLTNDIKKGMWVKLSLHASCGSVPNWEGEMWDNMKGNIRVVDVYGWEHEAGSVYSHDIIAVKIHKEDAEWIPVEHTPAQLKLKEQVRAMGF